jgi:hypothetical protein
MKLVEMHKIVQLFGDVLKMFWVNVDPRSSILTLLNLWHVVFQLPLE